MEELLIALISKTLNMEPEQVAELVKTDDKEGIKDNALELLLDLDSKRVKKLKGKEGDTKDAFDNGYKKAQGEVLGKMEDEFRTHYEITSDKKGLDLIGEIVSSKTKALEEKEITADDVKKSSTYQLAIDKNNKDWKSKMEVQTQDHEKSISGFKKAEGMVGVLLQADKMIDNEIKPIFSKTAQTALSQRKVIHERIQKGNMEIKANGMVVMLNGEGKALEDEHANPVTFESFVLDNVKSVLDLPVAEDRKSAGGTGDDDDDKGGQDGWKWNGQRPKDDEAYSAAVTAATSLAEKEAIQKSYQGED